MGAVERRGMALQPRPPGNRGVTSHQASQEAPHVLPLHYSAGIIPAQEKKRLVVPTLGGTFFSVTHVRTPTP